MKVPVLDPDAPPLYADELPLDEKIRTITRERNEREAVLSSMVEGVLAVDHQMRVQFANQALETALGLRALQINLGG